jgi:hypothetical protein
MALTKITKHVMYGSMLVQHASADITNFSSSSTSYTNWGSSIVITPKYTDSHLEVTFTGSTTITNQMPQNTGSYVYIRLLVNGVQEHEVTGANGAYMTGNGSNGATGGHMNTTNTRFGQHHHQDFSSYNMRTGVALFHIHAPGNTNAQTIQIQCRNTYGNSVDYTSGFLAVAEVSGPGYNLT